METKTVNERAPLYYKVLQSIEENIENGVWKKGDRIPSERELTQIYDVSRITIRSAISELVTDGKLEKVHGKGTYVTERSIIQKLGNVYSFSMEMEKQGKITSTQVVSLTVDKNPRIANKLGLSESAEIIHLKRLRLDEEDKPIMIDNSYFSYEKCPFIVDIDWNKKPLYTTLEKEYDIVIDRAVEKFRACMLKKDEALLLNSSEGYYGMLVKRVSYQHDKVICYSNIIACGDVFEFTVTLE